jgi:hypothetical protein
VAVRSKALVLVALSVAGLVTVAAFASAQNTVDCDLLLDASAARKLFDEAVADRASIEALEVDPPVLVWLEEPDGCEGKSRLRIMYRSEASGLAAQNLVARSRLRELGPVELTIG